MKSRPKLKYALARAVRRLVAAEISNAWKGAGHPEDIPDIERELKEATKAYREALRALAESP